MNDTPEPAFSVSFFVVVKDIEKDEWVKDMRVCMRH